MSSRPGFACRTLTPLLVIAGLVATTMLGCAFGEIRPDDPFDRELTLDRAQHRYTTLVRFSHFEKAKKFIRTEQQDEFMDRMRALEEARFTDFVDDGVELSEDHRSASVKVTYTIYTPSMPFEFEVVEYQEWSREGAGNDWRVWSRFEGLSKLAAN